MLPIEMKVDATKALSKTISELFSPVTELVGSLGDRVRIYRELTLQRTLKRAAQIAADEGLALKPPPLKFFVPDLENCSLEQEDDQILIDMWARLLVSASSKMQKEHHLFIRILNEMTAAHAQLLHYMVSQDSHRHAKGHQFLEEAHVFWTDPFVYIAIRNLIDEQSKKLTKSFPFAKLVKAFRANQELPGIIISFFSVSYGEKGNYPFDELYASSRGPFDDFDPISLAVLRSFGLVASYRSGEIRFGNFDFQVHAEFVTELGASFIASCTGLESRRHKQGRKAKQR